MIKQKRANNHRITNVRFRCASEAEEQLEKGWACSQRLKPTWPGGFSSHRSPRRLGDSGRFGGYLTENYIKFYVHNILQPKIHHFYRFCCCLEKVNFDESIEQERHGWQI